MARPTGIEPVSRASETLILSIELRARSSSIVARFNVPLHFPPTTGIIALLANTNLTSSLCPEAGVTETASNLGPVRLGSRIRRTRE